MPRLIFCYYILSYLALERNKGHLINSVGKDHNRKVYPVVIIRIFRLVSYKLYFPLANFHVGNGACIYRLNWLADLTTKGITSSFGIMVNYEYILEEKHYHRQQYRERRQVGISSSIHHYLRDYETVNKLCYIANANASKSKL